MSEPIPAYFGQEVRYTPNWSAAKHKAHIEKEKNHSHLRSYLSKIKSSVNLSCFWNIGKTVTVVQMVQLQHLQLLPSV